MSTASQAELGSPRIACLGLDPHTQEAVKALATESAVTEWEYNLDHLIEAEPVASVQVILFGTPPSSAHHVNEVCQLLRMLYPAASIYYITQSRAGFLRKECLANGATDAFLVPIELPTLKQYLSELLTQPRSESGGTVAKIFRSVKLVDVQAGQAMDFDTYLYMAANQKHIRYSAKGDPIDPERAARLATHKVGSLHIEASEMQKFYQFTAQQLKRLGSDGGIGETEKRDRMQVAVRELINDLFQDSASDASFEKGRAVLNDCQEIVKAYIMTQVSGVDSKWYEKLLALSQTENTAYTHSANVATFAAMFSMALGIGNPEQLAMAGLLHDIGLSEVPASVLAKHEDEWLPEERTAYQKHSKSSVLLIQNRKMIIPEIVLKIVAQHHERFDGTGYPAGMRGAKICEEAQLLALTDELCYLTALVPGKPTVSPLQAMKQIYDAIPTGEDGHKYNPEMVCRLYEMFKPRSP